MVALWGLLTVPLVVLLFLLTARWRKRAMGSFGDHPLVARLMPERSTGKPLVKLLVFCMAYALLVLGLANPQIGSRLEEVKRTGVDLIIALDLSNSMMAEDLSPNRLERAKRAIAQLIDRLKSDRIGIVVFAGEAFVQLPITTDYSAAKLFLSNVSTNTVPTQGTAIGNAIELAMESFDFTNNSGKAIIVITDGENHEDDALGAARRAVEQGVSVHTIGMGSAEGAPIPVYRNGKLQEHLKARDGSSVVTKLNEEMLQQVAEAGQGIFARASNANGGLDDIYEELNTMEKAEFGTKVYADYEDRFQYFIAAALLLFLLEFFISQRKSRWIDRLFATK